MDCENEEGVFGTEVTFQACHLSKKSNRNFDSLRYNTMLEKIQLISRI